MTHTFNCMFHTGSLPSFLCFLHVLYWPLFSFTSFFFFTFRTGPTFFHLHGFYMFRTGPLFSFTGFLQGFKRSISELAVAFGRIIYTFLHGLVKLFTCFCFFFFYNGRYCKSAHNISSPVFTCSSNNACQKRQCKSVFTEHLPVVSKAVNFL